MAAEHTPSAWWADARRALALLARLPVAPPATLDTAETARALRALPLAGAVVGLIGAAAFWLADGLGLPPLASALVALAVACLATGGLHEDGLADSADGLGAVAERARRLEIMRDSRTGAYGVLALVFAIGLKAAALAALAPGGWAPAALVAAHGAARGLLPPVMAWLPPARADGLAADSGRPTSGQAWTAIALGAALALVLLGPGPGLVALLAAAAAAAALAALARARLGGYTGDVLGAVEQVGEVALLLAAAAVL